MPAAGQNNLFIEIAHFSSNQISTCLDDAWSQHSGVPYPEFPILSQFHTGDPKLASVLIPMMKINDEWHILFTRRNADLPEHSGQVAFPGGRADPDDDGPETTALREAWEEIGILPDDVKILGRLHSFITITNYLVTPIVGEIPYPYTFKPAPDEVSRIFSIPLLWLLDPENYDVRVRELPKPWESVQVIYFKEYDGEVLWGASARFTLTLLEALRNNY